MCSKYYSMYQTSTEVEKLPQWQDLRETENFPRAGSSHEKKTTRAQNQGPDFGRIRPQNKYRDKTDCECGWVIDPTCMSLADHRSATNRERCVVPWSVDPWLRHSIYRSSFVPARQNDRYWFCSDRVSNDAVVLNQYFLARARPTDSGS